MKIYRIRDKKSGEFYTGYQKNAFRKHCFNKNGRFYFSLGGAKLSWKQAKWNNVTVEIVEYDIEKIRVIIL